MDDKMVLPLLLMVHLSFGLQMDISVPGSSLHSVNPDLDPDFTGPIQNVTVAVGREAILSCTVTELGHYKVGWMKAEDQTILTLHTRVITHNARVAVTHDNLRTWQLRIRQLKESDRGCYMCQINTSTMKKQLGCIDVHVPPDIRDEETSSDLTAQEGENATLVCRASGRPSPRILWRREDGEHLLVHKNLYHADTVDTFSGETLELTKLDRTQMGAYLCIASNDVPPAVSKRILLNVNFAPTVKVPKQLVGVPLGNDVQFECFVEAFPNTVNYWVKRNSEMLLHGRKHVIAEERAGYRVHLKLTIKNCTRGDMGAYMCVSTNSLGRANGTVRLYEIKIPTKPPTTTTVATTTTTKVYEEFITHSTEPEAENIRIMTTSFAPVESLLDDVVMHKVLSPSESTYPHEYSATYNSKTATCCRAGNWIHIFYVFFVFTYFCLR